VSTRCTKYLKTLVVGQAEYSVHIYKEITDDMYYFEFSYPCNYLNVCIGDEQLADYLVKTLNKEVCGE
jgi:hypothetical protein